MAVTKEQIFQAADQIAAAGQRPTLEAVRQIVGGSYTTISPALNEWKNRQKATAAPLREPAPQAVADRLAELGADVWAVALELANTRLAAERESLEASRADMEAAQAEATELADKLAAEVEGLKVDAEAQASKLAAIAADLEQARADNTRLQADNDALRAESATQAARVIEIEKRADDLKAELAHVHQEAEQARTDGDRLRAELAAVKAKAEAAEVSHQEHRQTAAKEAHRVAERMTKAEADRDSARADASAAREDAAKLRGQLEAVQTQHAELMALLKPKAEPTATAATKGKKGA